MKYILTQIYVGIIALLFVYTSASKFLDMSKFVFQMELAPVPLMKLAAPYFGWIIPSIEAVIFFVFVLGIFYARVQLKALYVSVFLLSTFAIYISIMLLSGSKLPCACGGLISTLGWKAHLLLNTILIIGGVFSIKYLQHYEPLSLKEKKDDNYKYKILSRA